MKKILAFSGSNSPTSINHQLILHVAEKIQGHELEVIRLGELHVPMFNIVLEKEGFPEDVTFLYEKIRQQDALVISVNEYNANISGFFKNVIDWLSRKDRKFLEGKKVLLMSTSPGARGGASALEYVKSQFPRFGGEVIESFSLPQFYENYDSVAGEITNEVFALGVQDVLTSFSQEISG